MIDVAKHDNTLLKGETQVMILMSTFLDINIKPLTVATIKNHNLCKQDYRQDVMYNHKCIMQMLKVKVGTFSFFFFQH